jgi:hypothetical protein
MDELKMTGNCLRGSRPFLSFDKSFDEQDHTKLIKQLFTQVCELIYNLFTFSLIILSIGFFYTKRNNKEQAFH